MKALSHGMALLALMVLTHFSAEAQFVPTPYDAARGAMGGVTLEYGIDTTRRVALSHRQCYALPGMASRAIALVWPLGTRGTTAAQYHHFGDDDYHEQQLTAGYHMKITDNLTAGVRGRYCTLGTADGHYPTLRWLAFTLQTSYRLSARDHLALSVGSRPWDESRPWNMHLGMQHRANNSLSVQLEVESEEVWRLRAGTEYCYASHYLFRCGIASRPLMLSFGLGFRFRHWLLDMSVDSHPSLGLTPQISTSVCF